jgi:CO/xanthine dehydrogenase Mo-binding subunit
MKTSPLTSPEERVEGREKVTGASRYAMDIAVPGALWAAFVGSPYPHARVVRVDASRALAMPGVRSVITGKDTAPARFGRRLQDWPVLAHDRARFIGDRVAAVAADTREQAEAAARAVEVECEELPAALTVDAAFADGAPVLHPERESYLYIGERPGVETVPKPAPLPHPNMQGRVVHEHGDVAGGFAAAARVFEHAFTYGRDHQAYLEPRAAAVWLEGETVRVLTTNKAPFSLRDQMARTLGIPAERIVVDNGTIGGDFGGKGLSPDEHILYFLAKKTGRPVRTLMSLTDDFQVTNPRHGGTIALRTAVDRDGRILAHQAKVVLDGGAYAAGKPVAGLIPGDAGLTLAGYRVPAAKVEVITVYTNTEPAGHVRAPGQPQNAFAAESHVDEIARGMGIDPLELRMRNAIQVGETDVLGHLWHDRLAREVLQTAGREGRWGQARPKGQGRGIGYCVRHVGRGRTTVVLTVADDAAVEVLTGAPDQGGGAHTMIQRVVAAELGIAPERVRVRRADTAHVPRDPGVGGSRVTPVAGNASVEGARKLREELATRDRDIDQALRASAGLSVRGESSQDESRYSVCAYVITVSVDGETGQVKVLDAALVADVGTVINPVAHRGQLEGAFVFGLGQTLMEELRIEDGRVVTTNLDSYKIPTMPDVPPLRITLLTGDLGPGPFGAKSVGELANAAVGPAVANAIRDAVGVRVWSAPITSEKVYEALRESRR